MNLNTISLADVRAFTFVLHESLQNDICSFRAMTVALTVSFKLINFNIYYYYYYHMVPCFGNLD